MGEFGSVSSAGTAVAIQTTGFSRILLKSAGLFNISNQIQEANDASSPATFSNIADSTGAFSEVILVGNLSEVIWIYSAGAVIYYALT